MVLLTPALRALRRGFPKARIEMLVNPLVGDLMERNPYLDEVIVYDKRGKHRGIRQMRQMAKRLRAKQFDVAVILHPSSVRSAILAFMAGIPERIGTNLKARGPFLTTKIQRQANIHEVQRYLGIVSPIVDTDDDGKLEFWGIDEDDEEFAEHILGGHTCPVIGINPCTTWLSKRWPAERFAALADILSRRFGASIVFTGGPDDASLKDEITNQVSSQPLTLIDRTTLWQLGALIKRCDLYITCDSGPMHISAAMDTPTIALFGATDPARHGPNGTRHVVVRKNIQCSPCYKRECKCKEHDCMDAIQVDDIVEIVAKWLSRERE